MSAYGSGTALGVFRFGFAAYVAHWAVHQIGDTLSATPEVGDVEATRTINVPGLARWAVGDKDLTVGWGSPRTGPR